ncbi:hypothetical protein DD238_001077 [Peronospora effusa]|uniref:DM14 domain-containing protein n=1 Tax=Peronospora effusa TaxID=542832 RepID=A0A3M6VK66_9STRA|nr:hypothetical protein DD238_001077 [Peronospora effusa]
MFWRRSHAKKAVVEETDDLLKLQKQLGITPISDADVQAEFQALFGASAGSSLTKEELLLYGAHDEDEDEEAKILRDLQLDGNDDESDGHQAAKKELRGVLEEVHKTAKESHRREIAEIRGEGKIVAPPSSERQVQDLKIEALTLKREGKIQEALAKFREAKQLQEKLLTQGQETSKLQHEKTQHNVLPLVDSVLDDGDDDIEVTDEDMQDPEFLAQLTKMGLTEDNGDPSGAKAVDATQELSALEAKIHECKVQAVQFKRQDLITEALACMRKIKELEAKRDKLRSSPVISTQASNAPIRTTLEVARSVTHSAPDNNFVVACLNLNAVPYDEKYPDSDNDVMPDVEVSSEDMNDPAFAVELQKVGSEDTPEPVQPELRTSPSVTVERTVVVSSRFLRHDPSIDEDYLIDAFNSDEETYHLTSVLSSGSLHSASSLLEAESITSSANHEQTKAESTYVTDLSTQLQKARQTALSLKRKGDIQGALEAMRRAKQIQHLIDHKQQVPDQPTSTIGSLHNVANSAKFQEIEQLLVDFGNRTMILAKENLSVNREKASMYLSKRKRYEAELEKLRVKRQNPLQPPPHYEIVTSSRNVVFELPFVPDDQIKVSVKSVNGLSQVAGRSVFVKFCLNFPSGTPHEGQTTEFQISSNASFSTDIPENMTSFVFKLARSRGTMRLFEIKKAFFEVWKPATLFRNPELVARAYLELAHLLTCCEMNAHIPFLGPNRKPCGGDIEVMIIRMLKRRMEVALQIRRPLKEKETRLETVEELVIGEYPEPMTNSVKHVSMPSVALEQSSASSQNLVTIGPKPTPDDQSAALKEDQPESTSAPSDDPHHLDRIVSYDVMNEELEKVAAKLPFLAGPIAVEWSDRYESLALKKQLLEIEMQTGNLTLEMYLERLHVQISADRVLLSQLVASNRRSDAARVLHRIKMMEKELIDAEGGR